MRPERAWTVAAIALAVGCSSASAGGLPASGTDVSCDPRMYISDGSCVDFPPFSDAVAADAMGNDAGAGKAGDGGAADAPLAELDGNDAPQPVPAEILAPCLAAGDVFHLTTTSLSGVPMTTGTMLDESGSTFVAGSPPALDVIAATDGGPLVEVEIEEVVMGETGTPAAILPLPGVYATQAQFPIVSIRVAVRGDNLPYTSALVELADVQVETEDGATPRLHSLLVSFRLEDPGVQTAEGCLKYIEPSVTQGANGTDAGAGEN